MNRHAVNSPMSAQARPARSGAGASQSVTFAAAATASTASGIATATAHQVQPTRQWVSRANRSR
jgi:hypothetical protein